VHPARRMLTAVELRRAVADDGQLRVDGSLQFAPRGAFDGGASVVLAQNPNLVDQFLGKCTVGCGAVVGAKAHTQERAPPKRGPKSIHEV